MCIDFRRFIYTSATPARKLIKGPAARVDLTIRRPARPPAPRPFRWPLLRNRPRPRGRAWIEPWRGGAHCVALSGLGAATLWLKWVQLEEVGVNSHCRELLRSCGEFNSR